MPKRVTSLRNPFPRHSARTTQPLLKKCRSSGEPLANTVYDLTGPRLEPQIFRSGDECVTARLTGQFCLLLYIFCLLVLISIQSVTK